MSTVRNSFRASQMGRTTDHPSATTGHAITEFARIELPGGGFDAFSAVHFSQRFPPHFHATFAIGVVETGATRLHTPRGEWIARAGTILAFSPGEVHSAEPLTDDGYAYRMIYPTREFMRELGIDTTIADAASGSAPLFRLPVIDDPALARQIQRAHVPLMEGASGAAAEGQLAAGLRDLVARYTSDASAPGTCRQSDLAIVERAQGYLQQTLAQQVRLTTLAEMCGLSTFHLIRVFRRVVGVPPYAYLVQLRVNRAQTLLCQGSSLADAAYSCGFSDQSHLTRTFKRVMGVPPGQYVRSVRAA